MNILFFGESLFIAISGLLNFAKTQLIF